MAPERSSSLGHGDLARSLVYIFPLFLLYGVGVAFTPVVNGADFVSKLLFMAVGNDRTRYLMAHGVLLLLYVVWLLWMQRRRRAEGSFFPMLLESMIYALTLGSLILFVMSRVLGIGPALAIGGIEDLGTGVILSVGAGVHEELVFRLGLMSGSALLMAKAGVHRGVALFIAFAIQSVVFAAVHHLGTLGDPFTVEVFLYRVLAGVAFGAIYYWRSLAHAVYAHALYDIYVLVLT